MATNNEYYLETSHPSRSEVEFILKNTLQRKELFLNTKNKLEICGNILISINGIPVADQCTCIRCKKVFSCSRNAGTSYLLRHQNSCGISDLCTQKTLKEFTKVNVKLSKEDTEAIKESQLVICTIHWVTRAFIPWSLRVCANSHKHLLTWELREAVLRYLLMMVRFLDELPYRTIACRRTLYYRTS